MIYKLENIPSSDKKEVEKKIEQGARFVVFNYRISFGLFSLLRISPALFVHNKTEIDQFRKKYNMLNLIFGPWLLFKGPWLTYNAYKVNQLGGIDVTKDIMLNITEQSLIDKEVHIKKIHDIFLKLKHSDKQNIKKALEMTDKKLMVIEKAYSALFINVEAHEEPFFVIGFQLNRNSELDDQSIKKALNKYYYKHIKFEFFELEKDPQFAEALIEQGELVYGN